MSPPNPTEFSALAVLALAAGILNSLTSAWVHLSTMLPGL